MKNPIVQSKQFVLASVAVLLTAPAAHAQCDPADLFGPDQQFATGNTPLSVAIGDLNGDGVPDLAVANFGSDTVSVLLGNGDGTFQTRVNFATGSLPRSVAIADLNGDGVPDLATANDNSNTVSVLLGHGDGTFQARQDFATGSFPNSVAIADLNGDGVPDLATANSNSDTVSVLLGQGNGTFQLRMDFPIGSQASGGSGNPRSVAIADLNGDGVPDLATANSNSSSVSVLMGNGDGTFLPGVSFPTGSQPHSVAIADFNGDGLPDLAIGHWNSNAVSVLYGNGNGTFQPRVDFATGLRPNSVAIGDLNGDGTPDIAVANAQSRTVSVLLNQCEPQSSAGDCQWSALGTGTNGRVRALAVFDQGSGPELFAAGIFTTAGGVATGTIARWVNSAWQTVGGPVLGNNVRDLYVYDDGSGQALYISGDFAFGINVVRWTGTGYQPVGFGFDGPVHALLSFDDGTGEALYACGSFQIADGQSVSRVAKWNGTGWEPLAGGVNDHAYAMTVFDDGTGPALYVGGNFTTADGQIARRIARWNGTAWSPLGQGLNLTVNALAVYDDGSGPALYAGGNFTTAGGQPANSIARWDGTSWSAVGGGINPDQNTVNTMTVFDSGDGPVLYAGGQFTTAGGLPASNIARWDGTTWASLGSGTNGRVVELVALDLGNGQALYAGGDFINAGGTQVNHIGRWSCDVDVPGDFATIQEAIDTTPEGQRRLINVAPGTYAGPIDFKGKNVTVRGAGAGQTILDGASGQILSVVRFSGGEPATASLERVIVRGGLTGTPRPDNNAILAGGGVFSYNSAASIRDCVIQNNRAGFGGGAYFWNSTGVIERVEFRDNTAFTDGGGLQIILGSPTVTDCVIEDNFANSRGGGVHAVRVLSTIDSTVIRNNRSDNIAGGISWSPAGVNDSFLAIVDAEITGNTADIQGGIGVQQNGALVQMSLQGTTVCENLPAPNVSGLYEDLGGNQVCVCTPDLDNNGLLNFFDVAIFALLYQQQNPQADFNNDGVINFFDFSAYLTAFNAGCP